MSWLDDRSVTRNDDGTYTISPDFEIDRVNGWTWTLRDTGAGWEATHPDDGFDGLLWASAEDAAHAVLGDPREAKLWGAS